MVPPYSGVEAGPVNPIVDTTSAEPIIELTNTFVEYKGKAYEVIM